MDNILKKITFILVCLFGITVKRADTCTPTMQRCRNCFPHDKDECRTTYTGSTEVHCTDHLSDPGVTMSAYNPNFEMNTKCWYFTCEKTFKRSNSNSTSMRMGGCGNGCSNITLIPYDEETVTSSASMQTISVSSHEECITLAVEMAFNGTDCNVVYSSSTDTCEVYTGCPKGGCPRTYLPSHQVEVVTCDSSVSCALLQTPVNGAVTMSKGYSTTSLATYTCNPGYGLVGNLHKTCNANGVWSTTDVPTCELAVKGSWGDWLSWSSCSTDCGNGTQNRQRLCDSPAPDYGGDNCTGNDRESQFCIDKMCPVNGSWGDWESWSNCSSDCRNGTQTRTRLCDNPAPAYGGDECIGNNSGSQHCIDKMCPVNGNWGIWENWSNCSLNCGNGTQFRTRNCDNPAPAYGGDSCTGSYTESQSCNGIMCSVNGSWSGWMSWSNCSSNCGIGTQIRTRNCDNPSQAYGGDSCTGNDTDIQSCNGTMCPVNGNWGDWVSWSNCSSNCGIGTQIRTRNCDNPSQAYEGDNCTGNHTEIRSCNGTMCPANGSWGGWESWSNCTSNCGIGTHNRTRNCDNPAPAYGGDYCIGKKTESKSCIATMCPGQEPSTYVPRKLYIMSCFCRGNSTFQGMTEDAIVQQLVKDTKIDEKTTALAQQKLKCTEDPRRSSKIIGSVGVAIISALFGLIVLIDCMSLYQWMFHSDNDQR